MKGHRVRQYYLEYRQVAIYAAVYLCTLTVASILFYKMMTSRFSHPVFWGWMVWTFVTAYAFYLFMRSFLGPAVQVYPEEIIISHPKRILIPRNLVTNFEENETSINVTFNENSVPVTLTIPVRPPVSGDPRNE